MNRQRLGSACAFVVACGLLAANHASAEVIGGAVTGGTSGGVFTEISPPAAVGPDSLESPNLVAFDEVQDLELLAPLPVSPGRVLGVGSVISSHYVAFDPEEPSTVVGFVDFDEPILGVIFAPGALEGTTPLLGADGTSYTVAPAINPDMMDMFQRAPGMPNRLLVQYGASSPGDHLRVVTGVAVPEPGALLLGALASIGFAMRRSE